MISHSVTSDSLQAHVTPWTVTCQAPLSMGFPRQEYWSGLPLPPPGDLPDTRIKPASPMYSALAGRFFPTEPPGKPPTIWLPLFNFSPPPIPPFEFWGNTICTSYQKYFRIKKNYKIWFSKVKVVVFYSYLTPLFIVACWVYTKYSCRGYKHELQTLSEALLGFSLYRGGKMFTRNWACSSSGRVSVDSSTASAHEVFLITKGTWTAIWWPVQGRCELNTGSQHSYPPRSWLSNQQSVRGLS